MKSSEIQPPPPALPALFCSTINTIRVLINNSMSSFRNCRAGDKYYQHSSSSCSSSGLNDNSEDSEWPEANQKRRFFLWITYKEYRKPQFSRTILSGHRIAPFRIQLVRNQNLHRQHVFWVSSGGGGWRYPSWVFCPRHASARKC